MLSYRLRSYLYQVILIILVKVIYSLFLMLRRMNRQHQASQIERPL